MVILDRPYVNIVADDATRTITLRWTDYSPSKEYREALDLACTAVKERGVRLWLADLRRMGAILQDDEKWTVSDWFPRMAKAGLKRMAILTSTDYFNQMSVDRIMEDSAPVIGFDVAYFDDEHQARKWLLDKAEVLDPA